MKLTGAVALMLNHVPELPSAPAWSQADLAGWLAVSRPSVNAIQTGKYVPGLPLAFKIAKLPGHSIESIFVPGEGQGTAVNARTVLRIGVVAAGLGFVALRQFHSKPSEAVAPTEGGNSRSTREVDSPTQLG